MHQKDVRQSLPLYYIYDSYICTSEWVLHMFYIHFRHRLRYRVLQYLGRRGMWNFLTHTRTRRGREKLTKRSLMGSTAKGPPDLNLLEQQEDARRRKTRTKTTTTSRRRRRRRGRSAFALEKIDRDSAVSKDCEEDALLRTELATKEESLVHFSISLIAFAPRAAMQSRVTRVAIHEPRALLVNINRTRVITSL